MVIWIFILKVENGVRSKKEQYDNLTILHLDNLTILKRNKSKN